MNKPTIAIIGAGNMGASLLGGFIATGIDANAICITDKDPNKLNELKLRYSNQTSTDNIQAVTKKNCIILAVKPQIITAVCEEIAATVQQDKPLIISVAAGISETLLQKSLGGNIPIVRCMPNTPALIRRGMTVLYANRFVSKTQHALAETLLNAVGQIAWVQQESLLNAVTALSGSGPAYFFLVMETLISIGQELGLSAELSKKLTIQTAIGATHMAEDSKQSIEQLRKNVTSKGGTTEAALRILEEHNLPFIFNKALHAAKQRAEELGS